MVEAGLFANAATIFAQASWRRFQGHRNRKEIESAYAVAAEQVINHYGGRPRDVQKSVVDLLCSKRCARTLVPGDIHHTDLAGLKGVYKLDNPPLPEVLGLMIAEIAGVIHDVMPQDHQNLSDIITMWQQHFEVLEINRHQAVMNKLERLDEKHDRLDEKLDRIYPLVDTSTEDSQILVTTTPPPDEDYRVDRPELDDLTARLQNTQAVGISGAVGVGGAGGVGKSLLAIRYANQEYSDNTLYISMDAGTQRLRMVRLARMMGVTLDPDQDDTTTSRDLRRALSQYDGLLILDNAENEADVKALIPPSGGPCKTIVTSRDRAMLRRVTSNEHVIEVGLFTERQARDCFARRLSLGQYDREMNQIDALCERLGYLPIAVDVAASTIASNQKETVEEWLDAFPDQQAMLDQLPAGDQIYEGMEDADVRASKIVRAVLRLSLKRMNDPEERDLLYALSCFDLAAGGATELIRVVANVEPDESASSRVTLKLNRLHQRSIINAPTPNPPGDQRHTVHRLMREVVQQEAGGHPG